MVMIGIPYRLYRQYEYGGPAFFKQGFGAGQWVDLMARMEARGDSNGDCLPLRLGN